jgi:DNA repair protein SbcD/Mre11
LLLAHLSDIHLGHRAYDRTEGGRNVREQDVAAAFQRAVEETVKLKPDLILLVGDIFDRPDPSPGALVALAQGLEAFRTSLPGSRVFMVAGARDTPRPLGDPGIPGALDAFPQVEAVTGPSRSVFLSDLDTHLYLVPHGAVIRRPYPELRIRQDAGWNILAAYAGVGTGAGPGLPLDPAPWDYVALGCLHQHQQVAPRVYYSGSLERVGPEPWREAAQEKGFLTFDLESGRSRFHPIAGRPVVALAPIRIPRGESAKLPGKVREVLGEVPGGIQGKIVRLRIEGLTPNEVKGQDKGLFAPLREQALHLAVEVDDFLSRGEENPLPLAARDRGFALRVLKERLGGEVDGGVEALALLDRLVDHGSEGDSPPFLEEDLLIRELRGSDLPFVGDLGLEAGEGLLAWMGGDGRELRAFTRALLWAVGLSPSLPGPPSAGEGGSGPALAVRLGTRERSFWIKAGDVAADALLDGSQDTPAHWSLPPGGVALAWCGEGGDSPEAVLDGGGDLLASARGAGQLESLHSRLSDLHPGLGRELGSGGLTAQDYERLRLEAEAADLGSQLRVLESVPEEVSRLEVEMREIRADATEVAGDLEAGTAEWHRERQDAQTNLTAYRDRGRELRARIRKLESLGSGSPCPTCGRLLEEQFQDVLRELRDEWEALVQDGQWWRRRREQLDEKPQELKELEARSIRLNANLENCTERLERARSLLRDMDELKIREREVRGRLAALGGMEDGPASSKGMAARSPERSPEGSAEDPVAGILFSAVGSLRREILLDCRTRLLHRGGRRLNRLTGGRILGLEMGDPQEEVRLVDGGGSAGVEADEDRAAAVVALRMALLELLAEEWAALGSVVLGDPFDRMGDEDQLRALSLLRPLLSRIPQVLLLTRGGVVGRAPEFFDGVFDFRDEPGAGATPTRSLPAGVGILRLR